MTADDIRWGRQGGRRVPKGTVPGNALEELEDLRRELGGSLRHVDSEPVDNNQLDLFGENPLQDKEASS